MENNSNGRSKRTPKSKVVEETKVVAGDDKDSRFPSESKIQSLNTTQRLHKIVHSLPALPKTQTPPLSQAEGGTTLPLDKKAPTWSFASTDKIVQTLSDYTEAYRILVRFNSRGAAYHPVSGGRLGVAVTCDVLLINIDDPEDSMDVGTWEGYSEGERSYALTSAYRNARRNFYITFFQMIGDDLTDPLPDDASEEEIEAKTTITEPESMPSPQAEKPAMKLVNKAQKYRGLKLTRAQILELALDSARLSEAQIIIRLRKDEVEKTNSAADYIANKHYELHGEGCSCVEELLERGTLKKQATPEGARRPPSKPPAVSHPEVSPEPERVLVGGGEPFMDEDIPPLF